jgi:hypothetical protein
MLKMIFALLILPMFAAAQDKGIDFEYNTNWEQVKAKAKTENKHIFYNMVWALQMDVRKCFCTARGRQLF